MFALVGAGTIVTAVDEKPKSTRRLARVRNIEKDPRVSMLIDRYDDDWTKLWWVRIDGTASVTAEAPVGGLAALQDKYPPYQLEPPTGPWIGVQITSVTAWSAAPST